MSQKRLLTGNQIHLSHSVTDSDSLADLDQIVFGVFFLSLIRVKVRLNIPATPMLLLLYQSFYNSVFAVL